jgi:hypothetical protein
MIATVLPGVTIVLLVVLACYLYVGRLRAIDRATAEHVIALRYAASLAPRETPGRFCDLFLSGNHLGIARLYPDFGAFRAALLREIESEAG